MHLNTRSLLTTALIATSAGAQVTTRDSAGITIRSTAIGKPTGVLRINATPTLDLGGANADASEFHRIRSVLRLGNGTIVVADNSLTIRFFSTAGVLIKTAGRKGSGPGEFSFLDRLILLRGDSIAAVDEIGRRLSVFTGTGQHVVSSSVTAPEGRRSPRIISAFADGALIGTTPDVSNVQPNGQPYYMTSHVFGYGTSGKPMFEAGTTAELEVFPHALPPEANMGQTAYWNLAYGREMTLVGHGDGYIKGDGTAFELNMHARDGKLRSILRGDVPLVPVTQNDRDAYKSAETRGRTGMALRLASLRSDAMPYPKFKPAFEKFLIGSDGRFWIHRYPERMTRYEEHWVVLAPDGRFIDEVTLPARFMLHGAGADYIIGTWRDADDVEHVQLFAIRAP